YDDIAFELMNIDAQAIIRGVDDVLAVREALSSLANSQAMLDRLAGWYDLRSEILTNIVHGLEGLEAVARGLGEMAALNYEFYKMAASAYAIAAADLPEPIQVNTLG